MKIRVNLWLFQAAKIIQKIYIEGCEIAYCQHNVSLKTEEGAKDNGAKRALIPIENKRNFLDVDADIVEHVDPVFYGEPRAAALKALALS